jgi:aspartate/methionine/tyrosine aminotransferase
MSALPHDTESPPSVERPALLASLSSLGRRVGGATALPSSPAVGLPELRERWRAWQRRGVPDTVPSSLPIVTSGLTHALSLAAELFGGPGKAIVVPGPYWGNYRQLFAGRTGARIVEAPAYADGRFDPRSPARALTTLPSGEPAVAILNLPSNPGGYSPTVAERRELRDSLIAEAAGRPLVVLCDDAYLGLVFEDDIPRGSMFWELVGAHPNLLPVKIDGATKELSFFGGRVGFLTFGEEPGSPAARLLEGKLHHLIRTSLGAAVGTSQAVVLAALRSEGIEREVEAVRLLLAERYVALRDALAGVDPELLTVLPCNAGCFALVELPAALGLIADAVRRHLLAHHDTGVISIEPRYLRLAHCSVEASALPELVRRVERAVKELAERE